jgi:uncharacterized membrane protein YgcG
MFALQNIIKMKNFIFVLLLMLAISTSPAKSQDISNFPINSYVVDLGNFLSPADSINLCRQINEYRKSTMVEMAIITIPNLGEYGAIEDYAQFTANRLKIGNPGVLFVYCMEPHGMRFDLSYLVEPYLTDGECYNIQQSIKPLMKEGKFSEAFGSALTQVQSKLGTVTPELREEKLAIIKKQEAKSREDVGAAFGYFLMLGVVLLVGYLIFLYFKKKTQLIRSINSKIAEGNKLLEGYQKTTKIVTKFNPTKVINNFLFTDLVAHRVNSSEYLYKLEKSVLAIRYAVDDIGRELSKIDKLIKQIDGIIEQNDSQSSIVSRMLEVFKSSKKLTEAANSVLSKLEAVKTLCTSSTLQDIYLNKLGIYDRIQQAYNLYQTEIKALIELQESYKSIPAKFEKMKADLEKLIKQHDALEQNVAETKQYHLLDDSIIKTIKLTVERFVEFGEESDIDAHQYQLNRIQSNLDLISDSLNYSNGVYHTYKVHQTNIANPSNYLLSDYNQFMKHASDAEVKEYKRLYASFTRSLSDSDVVKSGELLNVVKNFITTSTNNHLMEIRRQEEAVLEQKRKEEAARKKKRDEEEEEDRRRRNNSSSYSSTSICSSFSNDSSSSSSSSSDFGGFSGGGSDFGGGGSGSDW